MASNKHNSQFFVNQQSQQAKHDAPHSWYVAVNKPSVRETPIADAESVRRMLARFIARQIAGDIFRKPENPADSETKSQADSAHEKAEAAAKSLPTETPAFDSETQAAIQPPTLPSNIRQLHNSDKPKGGAA